ncbi:MAG TPA: acyclic terpene utilization AtuA family protein [Bacteroidales bacterium]|nr:acyclic terpene utilization AtuA family protein [Bacteroidales bacterium]
MKDKIRIGNAGGFWGDDLDAFRRQLAGGPLDYISIDFLAEITMSILKKQQRRNPDTGYVTDFVSQIVDQAEMIREKGVRILTNAGGINPLACARAIAAGLKQKNISFRIAVVEGDDIFDQLGNLYPEKADLKNIETGVSFATIKDSAQSANVYLGLGPLVKALEAGAEIIITGRVTDTAITMAPAVYEFGWAINDWDKIASALVAGHIIECGAQSSGGNFTDWHKIQRWEPMGYPIVEMYPDGTFTITKHENTGGLITVDTVKEQLVYEMGDPAAYISPDVIADFRTIHLEEEGPDRVRVSGVKGKPLTKNFKVSMAYADGYRSSASIIISGEEALEKARIFSDIFWNRTGVEFEKRSTEFVGYDACHHELAKKITPNEILLRLSAYDHDPKKLEQFSKAIAPLILSGPPGVAVTGGRPPVQEVLTYFPALIPKSLIKIMVSMIGPGGEIESSFEVPALTGYESIPTFSDQRKQLRTKTTPTSSIQPPPSARVSYRSLCLARSGDKGDMVNIGVIARSPEIYAWLKDHLTQRKIKSMFRGLCKGKVTRYELDNLEALNFLLEQSLDGGGTKSLMIDAQGKTFASALLNQKVSVPEALLATIH